MIPTDAMLADIDGIISELPGRALRKLALGEHTNPDECLACDVIWDELDRTDSWEGELTVLLVWHMGTTRGRGVIPYLRCLYIYESAKTELAKRRARATEATEATEVGNGNA